MEKIEYPKWLYHATQAAVIVNDPAEQEALGEGWQESPVEAPAQAAAPAEPPPKKPRK